MSTEFNDVGDFHRKFGLPAVSPRKGEEPGPRDVPDALVDFRAKFLDEELTEFKVAAKTGDHSKMFDALLDLVYVACGTAHVLGYPWVEGWAEVQRANMTKERAAADGSNSARGSSFDVVKPEGWTPPDIEGLLKHYGFDTLERKPFHIGDPTTCPVCRRDYADADVECVPGICKGTDAS